MATYEYVCLACEHMFQERRSMTVPVRTALDCPSCGSQRVRRKFSVFAAGSTATAQPRSNASGGCCGGACGCGQ